MDSKFNHENNGTCVLFSLLGNYVGIIISFEKFYSIKSAILDEKNAPFYGPAHLIPRHFTEANLQTWDEHFQLSYVTWLMSTGILL